MMRLLKCQPIVELGSERAAMAAFVGTVFLHGGALIYSSQEIGTRLLLIFLHIHPWIGPNVRIFIKNMGV